MFESLFNKKNGKIARLLMAVLIMIALIFPFINSVNIYQTDSARSKTMSSDANGAYILDTSNRYTFDPVKKMYFPDQAGLYISLDGGITKVPYTAELATKLRDDVYFPNLNLEAYYIVQNAVLVGFATFFTVTAFNSLNK